MLLNGIFPPITTPFYPDGNVYFKKIEHNVERYSKTPAAGLVVLGSTGEAVMLSDDERREVLRVAREATAPNKVLIAGTGIESASETLRLTEYAAELGYDAALIRTPHFYKRAMQPANLLAFYRTVADRSALPVLIGEGLTPVAVAHSLGGYLAITQQALFSSYTALAILGCTNQHVAPLNLDPAFIDRSATPVGRAALAHEILSALRQPYFEGPREYLQSWFHLADVPADVIAADSVTAKSVVPRVFGTAMIPGIVAEHAARIEVPVLVGYGVVDVSPEPRAEARLYCRSPDVTTVIVEGSAHCHNMASSRHRLWRRLLAWAATVAGD